MSRPVGLGPETLAIHPQRQPDELLSSWIVALARANGCKVHTLCSRMAGNQHNVWNRDVDRMAPATLIERLSALTAVDSATIRTYTLAHLAEQIDVDHHPNGSATWILPLGVYHRSRLRYGVQFCPMCLRMDERPYVRRSWRLAYYTECEHHGIQMMDRCPRCGTGFDYFRGDLGHRERLESARISLCTHCYMDLGYAMPSRFDWPDWQLTVAVRTLQYMSDFGYAFVGRLEFAAAPDLFLVLRQFIRLLSSRGRPGQLYDAVAAELWHEAYPALSERGKEFEKRSVDERNRLFGMAVWLLIDWPERFERVFAASGVHRHSLTADMKRVPTWFREQCGVCYPASCSAPLRPW